MQHFTPPAPVLNDRCYAHYIATARVAMETMQRLAEAIGNPDDKREAQYALDHFNDAVAPMEELIADANEPARNEEWWSEPAHAEAWGMGA